MQIHGMREMAGSGAIDLQGVARRMMSFDECFWFFETFGRQAKSRGNLVW